MVALEQPCTATPRARAPTNPRNQQLGKVEEAEVALLQCVGQAGGKKGSGFAAIKLLAQLRQQCGNYQVRPPPFLLLRSAVGSGWRVRPRRMAPPRGGRTRVRLPP